MPSTLVIQSHRNPLPFNWMTACLRSVKDWADDNAYDYRFIDDALFDCLDADLRQKLGAQKVIASDLARLIHLQRSLDEGYDCVLWCDADFLVFDAQKFILPDCEYALGREVWVQYDNSGKLRAYRKVHNAFLMFRRGNSFLDFYVDSAQRLLQLNQGGIPAQFIGPKLLTALHNIVICPVLELAGMLSPLVMNDLLAGQGKALSLFLEKSTHPVTAANLSASLCQSEGFSESDMARLIAALQTGALSG